VKLKTRETTLTIRTVRRRERRLLEEADRRVERARLDGIQAGREAEYRRLTDLVDTDTGVVAMQVPPRGPMQVGAPARKLLALRDSYPNAIIRVCTVEPVPMALDLPNGTTIRWWAWTLDRESKP